MITLRDGFAVGPRGTVFEPDLGLGRLESVRAAPYRLPAELAELRGERLLDAIRERPEPFFVKTHLRRHADDRAPAVYLVRDGRDSVVSLAHFVTDHERDPRFEGMPFAERLRVLALEDHPLFGHWSANVAAWRERAAPTALLRFEQLIADPLGAVGGACERIGVELGSSGRRPPAFADLHQRRATVFRRGEPGAWRDEMPAEAEREFWREHRRRMQELGYRR